MEKVIRFLVSDDGPTAVEYSVMLALIIGMCIAAIALAGGPVEAFWTESADKIGTAVGTN